VSGDMNRLVVRDGWSQAARVRPALQDGYFHLDEMPFADLLAMAAEFARLVKFYKLDYKTDGDWSPYFSADVTIVIAQILSTKLSASERSFDAWWSSTGDYKAGAPGWTAGDLPMTQLAVLLDSWLTVLAGADSEAASKLCAVLVGVIERLCEDTAGFAAFLATPGAPRLDPLWAQARARTHKVQAKFTKANLKSNYYAFVKAVEMVQKEALQQLPVSMKSQNHDPAVALLIAFVDLFGKLKTKLNGFTRRHLDYYYDKVLKVQSLGAIPDSTYLVFEPAAPEQELWIPAGTAFVAGQDKDKRDILFASEEDLVVSDAHVEQLYTLYFNRDPNVSPERTLVDERASGRDKGWPTHAWTDTIEFNSKQVLTERDRLSSRPLLGAPKKAADFQYFADARLGFALASNVLLLGEGKRSVSVNLRFDTVDLETRMAQLATTMHDAEQGEAAGIHRSDVFFKVFRNLFKIGITTGDGWYEVEQYLPTHGAAKVQGDWLNISFELPLEAPPVEGYLSKIHGENYNTTEPVLRFVLNPNAYLYPYGLLRDLPLRAVRIDVKVTGCRQLILHNNIGQLSASTPFNPFGPIPEIGSFMVVGCAEAASKNLSSFDVNIEWGALPAESGGFPAYYHGYEGAVEAEQYLATVTVLADGQWAPSEEKAQPAVQLFRAAHPNSANKQVDKRIELPCDGVIHRFKPGNVQASSFAYSQASRSGFFKFTLASPKFAFGHREYPQAMARALKRNMKQKDGPTSDSTPNLPYTPLVNAISVDYSASSKIDLEQLGNGATSLSNAFMHLHPFGWELLGSSTESGVTLVRGFRDDGYLYIGLSASSMQATLTLMFHLREDSLPQETQAPAILRWTYLSGNAWKPLLPQEIVSDSTHGFMKSGVIALSIPGDIDAESTVMPSGLMWLRLCGSGNLEKFCSMYAVHAQAVKVTRCEPELALDDAGLRLPAASIQRSANMIPGLGTISQVTDSLGGRRAETRDQLRMRVSERLRHKNRAVIARDYEQLILQQFPDIFKVKCFANMATDRGPDDCIRPGHILIVALPHRPSAARTNRMLLLNGNLVQEVRDFITKLAPPMATISVENPVYEQIQVRCTVRWIKGVSGGQYINRLNEDISEFLSPWNSNGHRQHFGWNVRQHDVESFILGLGYVDSVSRLSVLRIAPSGEERYSLFDTAAQQGGGDQVDIRPNYPWSIAVPVHKHAIDITRESDNRPGQRAGLKSLDIGQTFIISAGDGNGQTK
jgi:hypothetical protein